MLDSFYSKEPIYQRYLKLDLRGILDNVFDIVACEHEGFEDCLIPTWLLFTIEIPVSIGNLVRNVQ